MPQEGDTVRNKRTGEMAVWRGGRAVPVGGGSASAVGPIYGSPPKPSAPAAPKTSYRPLTPQQAQQQGLPPGSYQQSSEGKIDKIADAPANSQLSPEMQQSVREEARAKIKLIDSLKKRSKDGWFATGFGSGAMSSVNGTTASDVAKDVQTVAAAGALQRIMEMSASNGGKNPLTPLSNADFQALGQSIANLDPGLSDDRFQGNLDVYRDIYLRAFKAAGGSTTGGKQETKPPAGGNRRMRYNPATGELE